MIVRLSVTSNIPGRSRREACSKWGPKTAKFKCMRPGSRPNRSKSFTARLNSYKFRRTKGAPSHLHSTNLGFSPVPSKIMNTIHSRLSRLAHPGHFSRTCSGQKVQKAMFWARECMHVPCVGRAQPGRVDTFWKSDKNVNSAIRGDIARLTIWSSD